MQSLSSYFQTHFRFFKGRSRVLVACSAGPDSTALVHALKEESAEISADFEIAHVNHKLRGKDSNEDEKFVRRLAKEVGWRCHVVSMPIRRGEKGNLEELARDARYQALRRIAEKRRCRAVLTAHTADDQSETIFMNLMRGVGPDGLAGMESLRKIEGSSVWLGRPFLSVSKKELLAYLGRLGRAYRFDKSNLDHGFLRNWLRRTLLPQIEKRSPGFSERMGNLARLAGDEKHFWEHEIEALQAKLFRPYRSGRLLDLGGLLSYPAAVQRRFLRRSLGKDTLTFEAVERLRQWMQAPPTGGRCWQLRKGWIVERLSKSKGSPSAKLFWFKKSEPRKGSRTA